jgi:hypothetical protein
MCTSAPAGSQKLIAEQFGKAAVKGMAVGGMNLADPGLVPVPLLVDFDEGPQIPI